MWRDLAPTPANPAPNPRTPQHPQPPARTPPTQHPHPRHPPTEPNTPRPSQTLADAKGPQERNIALNTKVCQKSPKPASAFRDHTKKE